MPNRRLKLNESVQFDITQLLGVYAKQFMYLNLKKQARYGKALYLVLSWSLVWTSGRELVEDNKIDASFLRIIFNNYVRYGYTYSESCL